MAFARKIIDSRFMTLIGGRAPFVVGRCGRLRAPSHRLPRSPYAPTNEGVRWFPLGFPSCSDDARSKAATPTSRRGPGRQNGPRTAARAAPPRPAARPRRRGWPRAKPARTRREALKRDRAAAREERLRTRQALMSGDERALPARDQGPVRRYVRDFVDSRRTAAEFFFWIAIVVLAGSFIRPVAAYVTLFWMIALIVIVVDSMMLTVRLKSALKRKFPDESLRGTTSYGLLRAMQIRRLRLPPPKVKPGATI